MGSFDDLIKKASKEWKAPDMMDGAKKKRGAKLPFSSPLMNWATYGGIPRDKITEFCGNPGGGKSTTAIDICKNAVEIFKQEHQDRMVELREHGTTADQKIELAELEENGPRRVLYIDLEHSFDLDWANKLGIDDAEIDLMQPPDIPAEALLNMIIEAVQTNELGLIVLDSIPSLVPQAVLDKKLGERTVSALAGLLTTFLIKLVPLLTRHKTTFLMINQVRDNMDNPYVIHTPGGNAVKFYCSLRLMFTVGNPIDLMGNELPMKTEDPAGYVIKVKSLKQKSAPWDRKVASYYLLSDSGIKPALDYAQLAINKYGIIKKAGGWFTLADPDTGEILENDQGMPVKIQGMPKVYDYLENNLEYYTKLKNFIENDIN